MTPQLSLFIEEQKRDEGIAKASAHRDNVLLRAKYFARIIALEIGYANADLVHERLIADGYKSWELGNAAGAVFRGKEWECIGYIKSTREGNHARTIRQWRLKECR